MSTNKVALFVDFQTVAQLASEHGTRVDVAAILGVAEELGQCKVRHAYADWTRFEDHGPTLVELAFELTQIFESSDARGRDDSVALQLAIDAIETALTWPDIEHFVLAGSDRASLAVARRLRSYGKQVVAICSDRDRDPGLESACDRVLSCEDVLEIARSETVAGIAPARELLIEALHRKSLESGSDGVLAASLKHTMLAIDARFDEVALGFPQFKDFLQAQSDLIETRLIDQQLWVRSLGAETDASTLDPAEVYRAALRSADLRLLEGRDEERSEVLSDAFRLFGDFPGEFSLPECVIELVERYDAEGVPRDRNLVRDIVKLVRFTDLCDPVPESFQFDPLTLADDVNEDDYIDHCESVYLGVFLESRLPIEAPILAGLLYGSTASAARVTFLAELATERLEDFGFEIEAAGWEWPEEFLAQPELAAVLAEVERCPLDETASVRRAAALADRGHAVRPKSFEQAKLHFLSAARMTLDLLRESAPGASQIDLETYMASYCFAAAGAHYLGYEYARASQYYLAFFALLDETRPVWDKMFGLVPPMMSYYFSTVLRALREPVTSSPGFTHPANMAINLYEHEHPEARQRWLELVADLSRVNPTALRLVADRLTQLEEDKAQEGAAETRLALAEVA